MSPARAASLARQWRSLAVALVAVGIGAAAAGLASSPQRTWPHLLVGNVYLLSAALAGAVFLCIHYLSGAGWSVVVRRVAEAMMGVLPVAAVLMLSVFFGRQALYPWAAAGEAAHGGLPHDKAVYLATPFVFLRMAIVLGAWVALARALRRASLRQDEDPALEHHHRLVRWAAVFAGVFALTFTLASVDWLMSLDPHWYSTIFAVYLFAGLLLLGLAVLTLIVLLLRRLGPLEMAVGEGHLHDLGRLIFAFSTFWAYIWLSQYLLIWYGNIPEEVTHYVRRTSGPWLPLFLLNLAVNWVIPFLALLTRAAKRDGRVLAAVCVLLLFGRWLDLYLLIVPESAAAPVIGAPEILLPLGYGALFALVCARVLAGAPLLPPNDPHLGESLHHHT